MLEPVGSGAPLPGLSSQNPEHKLFVGGAPPGTDEATLEQVRAPLETIRAAKRETRRDVFCY